jgi:hypothetical protein
MFNKLYNPNKSKGDKPMKTISKLLAVSVLFLSACTTSYQTRSMYDDVYYSKKDDAAVATTTAKADTKSTSPENYSKPLLILTRKLIIQQALQNMMKMVTLYQ